MVMAALQPVESIFCVDGGTLRGSYIEKQSAVTLNLYERHMDFCGICKVGGFQENYRHPAVAEAVRLLGGREIILTDNPMSDRARFQDAYREVVARERMKMGMTPVVAKFVEDNRPLLLDDKRSAFDTGERALLEKWAKK